MDDFAPFEGRRRTRGVAVAPGNRFCPACGTDILLSIGGGLPAARGLPACPACTAPIRPAANFCNACGTALTGRPRPAAHGPSGGRKGRLVAALGLAGGATLIVAAVVLQSGPTEGANPSPATPTAAAADAAAATPSAAPEAADYPPLADPRELALRPWGMLDEPVSFNGWVYAIRVAPPGEVFVLGDEEEAEFAAELVIAVPTPDDWYELIAIGYDGDTTGMFLGAEVHVYGTVVDTEIYEDDEGDLSYILPIVAADLVEIDPFDGLFPQIEA